MYKYSLKGHCPENRDKALCEVDDIIRKHGFTVAFSNSSDESINLMLEVAEKQVESLIFYLEKYVSVSELKQNETQCDENCKVLINLLFSN